MDSQEFPDLVQNGEEAICAANNDPDLEDGLATIDDHELDEADKQERDACDKGNNNQCDGGLLACVDT